MRSRTNKATGRGKAHGTTQGESDSTSATASLPQFNNRSTYMSPRPNAATGERGQDKKLFVKLVFMTVIAIVVLQIYIFATVSTNSAQFSSLTQTQQESDPDKALAIEEKRNVERLPTSTRGVLKQLKQKEKALLLRKRQEKETKMTKIIPSEVDNNELKMDAATTKAIEKAIAKCKNDTKGTKLNLSNLGLTTLSSSLMEDILEFKDTLDLLNLGGNSLSALPEEFSQLAELRTLFFANNSFKEVPAVIGKLPKLFMISFKSNQVSSMAENVLPSSVEWLIMTDNKLTKVPDSLGKLTKLRKLMLAGNQLTTLPDSMKNCQELELVRLASNLFDKLPEWFLKLPNLTWLAASGNPSVLPAAPMSPVLEEHDIEDSQDAKSDDDAAAIQRIPASQLTIREILGEGASGVVYKADWKQDDDDEPTEVAIKVFKGEMTSDGLPMDELRGTLQLAEFISQEHATDDRGVSAALQEDYPITPVLGVITKGSSITSQLPSSADADTVHLTAGGLVMQLIDAKYKILGGPPSFDTITRDTFDDSPYSNSETSDKSPMSARVAMDLSRHLTHAIMELHAAHLTHGDIYAHNLLASIAAPDEHDHNVSVSVRLCDLGASTYVGPATGVAAELSETLKALELRSLGKFMDDLLMHLVVAADSGDGDDPRRIKLEKARNIALTSASLFQGNQVDWSSITTEEEPSSTMEALTMVHTLLMS